MHYLLKLYYNIFYIQSLYDLLIMAFLYAAYLLKNIAIQSLTEYWKKWNLMKFNIFRPRFIIEMSDVSPNIWTLCNRINILKKCFQWISLFTVKKICVNLTESLGSPSNRQYYIICHILTANSRYAVEATEQFNQQNFLKQVIFSRLSKWQTH